MTYNIAVLPGDGIGPEVAAQAARVLDRAAERHGFKLVFTQGLIGGAAIDTAGVPLPAETLSLCKQSHAVLLGAVGGYKWDSIPPHIRPEAGLLAIRSALGLYANLRPAIIYPALAEASPLKPSILLDPSCGGKLDILIIRELTGGIYFGERGEGELDGVPYAWDTERYNQSEISRIGRVAFDAAMRRNHQVCSIDKANVLASSRLWRKTMSSLADEYPDITLSHMYVDNAAMQLIRRPSQFDVIVTNNMFGDILSDEMSQITGSIGLLPSASLGEGTLGLYEPVHGSAPDIAGQGIANPFAAILSAAMLLRYSLGQEAAAQSIEQAVSEVISSGIRTVDMLSTTTKPASTISCGDAVLARM